MTNPNETFSLELNGCSIDVKGETLNELQHCLQLQIEYRRSMGGTVAAGVTVNSKMIEQLLSLTDFLASACEPVEDVDESPMTRDQVVAAAQNLINSNSGLHAFDPISYGDGTWGLRVFVTPDYSFDARCPNDLKRELNLLYTEDGR